MTKKELNLLDFLVDTAADELSNNCCNDIPYELISNFTHEERVSLDKEYHEWNGDPEEHTPRYMPMHDSSMLRFLYEKLKNDKNNQQQSSVS